MNQDHSKASVPVGRAVTARGGWRFPLCPDLGRRENRAACCLRPDKPPKRPDPGIYSQLERYTSGAAPTWDSPDITTNLSGRTTLDESVVVTVRNYSSEAAALGTQVKLEYSQFGIGFPRNVLALRTANLNRAGQAGAEHALEFYLPTAIRDSFSNISVFVSVLHPHDKSAANNEGEQAWSASTAQAGGSAQFTFQIHNSLAATTDFNLVNLEADWNAHLSATTVTLLPGQTTNVTLTVEIPAGTTGNTHFNVLALARGSTLYGGIHHRFDL